MAIAAKALGVGRSTLYDRIASDPELKKLVDAANQVPIDNVEGSLYRVATRERTLIPRCFNHTRPIAAVCPDCNRPVTVEVPDADVKAIQLYLTNKRPADWKNRRDVTVENVVPVDAALAFARAVSEAVNLYVSDAETRRRLVEAFDAAAASLESVPTVH